MSIAVALVVDASRQGLAECLASLAALGPDEVLAVDAGASARDLEVLSHAGARVVPWNGRGGFAAARQKSVEEARADWVLCLDADHRMDRFVARDLERALSARHDALGVRLRAVDENGVEIGEPWVEWLLFRRRARPTFVGPTFESAEAWAEGARLPWLVVGAAPITQVCSGNEKLGRSHGALLERLQRDDEDLYALSLLALSAASRGDGAATRRLVEAAERVPVQGEPSVTEARARLRLTAAAARLAILRGDGEAVRHLARRARDRIGEHPDLALLEGLGSELTGATDRAFECHSEALRLGRYVFTNHALDGAGTWNAHVRLAACGYGAGDYARTVAALDRATALDETRTRGLARERRGAFAQSQLPGRAAAFARAASAAPQRAWHATPRISDDWLGAPSAPVPRAAWRPIRRQLAASASAMSWVRDSTPTF